MWFFRRLVLWGAVAALLLWTTSLLLAPPSAGSIAPPSVALAPSNYASPSGAAKAGTPTPRPTSTAHATPTPTGAATPTPKPVTTPTPTATPRPTATPAPTPTASPTPTPAPTPTPTPAPTPTPTPAPTPTPTPALPTFSHVFTIVMENEESSSLIGNSAAPYINGLANSYGLATQYYGVSHPSLPNYLALTAGSTFGIASDCTTCWVGATNLADQIEAGGRSWKAYLEGMPSACFVGDAYPYMQKHNPWIYYNDIRTNAARCAAHVVPFTQLGTDLAGGRIVTLVISPLARTGFQSSVAETHYSLLRTIEDSWNMPRLGGAACTCTAAMREYFR